MVPGVEQITLLVEDSSLQVDSLLELNIGLDEARFNRDCGRLVPFFFGNPCPDCLRVAMEGPPCSSKLVYHGCYSICHC